jgi:hypothetical protein
VVIVEGRAAREQIGARAFVRPREAGVDRHPGVSDGYRRRGVLLLLRSILVCVSGGVDAEVDYYHGLLHVRSANSYHTAIR